MTIPTILIDDNVLTDQMLQNITPFIGISSGISVTALMSFIQGKRGFEIMKDTLNSGVNQALTTGVMTLTKDSFVMVSLNEFSKSISTISKSIFQAFQTHFGCRNHLQAACK